MRARKRSSSVVARLSNVGLRSLRAPPYRAAVVSIFLGQPPRSAWYDKIFAAMRRASSVANQESGCRRYEPGPAASAGAALTTAHAHTIRVQVGNGVSLTMRGVP